MIPGATATLRYPLRVAGCVTWMDASFTSTITESGGAVSTIMERSGVGYSFNQATGGIQPTTGTRTQNSRNVLDFDGSDDFIQTGGAFNTMTLAQPFTVFIVCASDDGADGTEQRVLSASTTAMSFGKSAGNAWRVNFGTLQTGGTADTSAHYFTLVANGASSILRVNGSQIIAANIGANGWNAEGVRLCRNNGASTNYWDGWVGELLLYNTALSSTDYGIVEGYLASKWGL